MDLINKTVLITGAARRLGKEMALAAAKAGANIIIHHNRSHAEAEQTKSEIDALGRKVRIIQSDFSDPSQVQNLIAKAFENGPVFGLINNASIFSNLSWENTTLADWDRHISINLTAPFLLCQAFAKSHPPGEKSRIINILDWRALRPGTDHFPYTISKSGLLAMTKSLAAALAPEITVNGIAFGAILPPSDGGDVSGVLDSVPAVRWAEMSEVHKTLLFLLTGPEYITGEVIHLDGGRHLI
jgi:NAD(P)-dependent dehydrogenase (short-subunit alcohol dehydrogenase family)